MAGDAIGLAQLALAQPAAGGQLAVEDLAPQRVGEGVDGRHALERSRRGHRRGSCRDVLDPRNRRGAAGPHRQREQAGEHEPGAGGGGGGERLAEDHGAEHAGGQRLGERERRGLGGAQARRPRANST